MKIIQKRFLLFLIGCIGARTLLAYTAKNLKTEYLPYLGYLTLLPAIGFMYIYMTNSRQTGSEVFGDKIWWNDLRPVHAFLYLLFAYNAINKNKNAWSFLAVDVLLGLSGFLLHHYTAGSFASLTN